MSRLTELIVYLEKKGIKETLSRIKLRYLSISEFVVFHRNLESSNFQAEISPDIKYVKGEIEALQQFRDQHPSLPREFYIDQTHNGKEFYLGYYKGDLAQICWLFYKGDYSRFFSFKDDSSCELNYIITLPQFRGNGLPAKFTNYICDQLKSKKIKNVVVAIASGNANMVKGMKGTDFIEIKRIISYCSFLNKMKI